MHNVDYEIKGDKLVITVDIGQQAIKAAPPSSTGKTNLVGSTSGYTRVGERHKVDLSLSVTVTAKPKK